jgi:hypothetical protein
VSGRGRSERMRAGPVLRSRWYPTREERDAAMPNPGMQLRLVTDAGEAELRAAVARFRELELRWETLGSHPHLHLTVGDELEEAREELCRVAVAFVQGREP